MTLLVIESENRPTPLLAELCRGRSHRFLSCRSLGEAMDLCLRFDGNIDWIVVNGVPEEGSTELETALRMTGCRAPIAFISAEIEALAQASLSGHQISLKHLTRLDLHRMLTRPGGIFCREEAVFEYHAAHPAADAER